MQARILCVDDEDDICQLLDTILTMCGYSTAIATTGDQALALSRSRPDLVVLDINLPDIDGIEVCRRIRRVDRRVPVLFLTAATGARRLEAMAAGGSAFLEKPFDVDELLETIDSLLKRRTERRTGRDRRARLEGFDGRDRRVGERRSLWRGQAHGRAGNGTVGMPARSPSFGTAYERHGREARHARDLCNRGPRNG